MSSFYHDAFQSQSSGAVMQRFEYTRTMGSFKPKFQGIPQDYFPLNRWQVFKYTLYVLGIIGVALGIMIGFLFWVLAAGLIGYTIAWCVTFLVFAVVLIVLFYWGGRRRIREEKRLIIEQQRKQEELMNKNNSKDAKRKRMEEVDP